MPSEDEVRAVVRRVVADMSPGDHPTAGTGTGAGTGAGAGDEIAIGADHGGYALKQKLAGYLSEKGYRVNDCGTHSGEAVDYPDFARAVALAVAGGASRWGIVIDGAGIGSCMAANKVRGIRAALCYDISSARNSREHNHANVMTLGAGLIGDSLARQIVDAWLGTEWGGGRHARRVEKIEQDA